MTINPELHYLDHIQNTSIGKQCSKFAKAPRFQISKRTMTDFNYHPKGPNHTRSCNFGFGNRASMGHVNPYPSPNKYNVSKFPNNNCSAGMGMSRDEAIFGTITVQIKQKSKIPAPGTYESMSSLKDKKITMKQRLPDEITLKLKSKTPGPGEYSAIGINQNGRFPTSKIKNVRYIIMDFKRKEDQEKPTLLGPGTYDLFNSTSKYNYEKISQMRHTTSKPFGTDKRKGPEERHRLFVPGPGMYDTFSTFGNNLEIKHRSMTEY